MTINEINNEYNVGNFFHSVNVTRKKVLVCHVLRVGREPMKER